ncbi:MAG: leucyl aminopeptidase family protein [Alphaproteobacteria bacterium]|nr:leucyl aminopeptidase family protein [Alphaproteobacteria bacterium]
MNFLDKKSVTAIPLQPVIADGFDAWLKKQDAKTANWVKAAGFTGSEGAFITLPAANGGIARVLFGTGKNIGLYTFADLPGRLPKNAGGYFIDAKMDDAQATNAALGWALGSYYFGQLKSAKKKKEFAPLVWPANADKKSVKRTAAAMYLVRDLVNTPANLLGPAEIADAALKVAKAGRAKATVIKGEDLLKKNYPAIYEVGKGSPRRPRLIDFTWGNPKHKKITLVGKGVAFDTGGLNLKPGNSMYLMKKDMGGAAHVLGLAQMIMAENLPVRLRVLIAAVENSVDGDSFRPSDVIKTRKGLSVEVGDTDAEGRIILCDALYEACTEKPDLLVNFATLTGAARVALGPDLPALFSNDDDLAADLMEQSKQTQDPLWHLPLWQPYKGWLDSKIADTNTIGGSFGGAIIAALYLDKFVDKDVSWAHIDTFAWNASTRPGRPEGGEALGIRAVYAHIAQKYGKRK